MIRQWSIFGWLLMTIFAAPLLAQEVFDPIDAMDDDEQTGLESCLLSVPEFLISVRSIRTAKLGISML